MFSADVGVRARVRCVEAPQLPLRHRVDDIELCEEEEEANGPL